MSSIFRQRLYGEIIRRDGVYDVYFIKLTLFDVFATEHSLALIRYHMVINVSLY